MTIIPPKLAVGGHIRVVAPSASLAVIDETPLPLIEQRFADLGLEVSFGAHVREEDAFSSSAVASRLADVHEAFADPAVTGILTAIGGYNANQLLPGLDYRLISDNPKVLCGYSDITALGCAIYAKTRLVTYNGPHYSTFGMRDHCEDTIAWFRACLLGSDPLTLHPSGEWTDDRWYADQDDRYPQPGDNWWVLREGEADGTILGGNLCTLKLLQGTPYMPDLDGAVLLVEDDLESAPHDFDRDLTSLLQQPGFGGVRGLVIGRFQRASEMTRALLEQIVDKPELEGLPVLANADFGHTSPMFTFPVGGQVELRAAASQPTLRITVH